MKNIPSSLKRTLIVFFTAFIIFLVTFIAYNSGWVGQSSFRFEKQQFNTKAKSWISLTICTEDTSFIDQKYFTRFPLYTNDTTLSVCCDTNLIIEVTSNNPGHAEFRIGNNSFRVFIFPGDTSNIELHNYDGQNTWASPAITRNSQLINYYLNKDKFMGYLSQWEILSFQDSIKKFCNKADLLYDLEKQYFDSCNSQSNFPTWFQYFERNDILYFNLKAKLAAIYNRSKYLGDTSAYKTQNLVFLDSILINNRLAILSPNYFDFLTSYTIHIGHEKLYILEHMDHAIRVLEIFEEFLSEDLDKDVSDKYFVKLSSEIISPMPSAYVRFNLDTNNLYQSFDEILASATKRTVQTEYIDYLNLFYDALKEKARNLNLLTVGNKAPEFFLKSDKGAYHQLKDFKGKVVMLNFWAEYCMPCLNSVPAKNEIVDSLSSDQFVLINIFLTDKELIWKNLIAEKDIKGINLICSREWSQTLMGAYNIYAIPAYAILDREGKIIKNGVKDLKEAKRIIKDNIH